MRGGDPSEGVRVVYRPRRPQAWPPRPPALPRPVSGDWAPVSGPPPQHRFRRARSSEWDGAGEAAEGGRESNMLTLDKRVSVSSEQLDLAGGRWTRPALQPDRRTPFEMFLEDDGPYSRYAPWQSLWICPHCTVIKFVLGRGPKIKKRFLLRLFLPI